MPTSNGGSSVAMPPSGVRGKPFAKGNPGRKRGSRNRSTLVAAALLEDEGPELLRKAVQIAKAGDVPMLKFFLGRYLPRDRTVTFDWPATSFAEDAVEAQGSVLQLVAEGRISPSEGAALATVMESYMRAIDLSDLVKRIDRLEGEILKSRGNTIATGAA